ncbi:MAG: hypothetical protein ACR2ME_06635 [Acidimicrobiia bacterium]
MNRIGAAFLFVAIACSGVGETTTTLEAAETEPARFVAELTEEGVEIDQAETFSTEPVGGEGQLFCLGDQEVRVYLFAGDDEAAAAAARIDPNDPSNMGSVIIEWAGNPRFWQRGSMLVLYLGKDQATEDLITAVLGQPFAEGQGPGRGLPGLPGPCTSS